MTRQETEKMVKKAEKVWDSMQIGSAPETQCFEEWERPNTETITEYINKIYDFMEELVPYLQRSLEEYNEQEKRSNAGKEDDSGSSSEDA